MNPETANNPCRKLGSTRGRGTQRPGRHTAAPPALVPTCRVAPREPSSLQAQLSEQSFGSRQPKVPNGRGGALRGPGSQGLLVWVTCMASRSQQCGICAPSLDFSLSVVPRAHNFTFLWPELWGWGGCCPSSEPSLTEEGIGAQKHPAASKPGSCLCGRADPGFVRPEALAALVKENHPIYKIS